MSGNVGNLPNVDNMDIQYAQSAILTPCDLPFARDGIAAEASENVETLTMADVNLADLSWARAEGTVRNLRDRRFDLYHIDWDSNPDHSHAPSGGPVPAGGHNSPGGG
jgi:predicted amidohydrolase